MGTLNWNYVFQNGYNITITTSDTPDGSGNYGIVSVTGIDGSSNPLSLSLLAPNSWGGNDNIINPSFTDGVNGWGVSFEDTNSGVYYNIWTPTSTTQANLNGNDGTNSNLTAFTDPLVTCFTPNTLISTPTGSTPVKDLHIGDLILNHQGQSVPVKWIGRQRFHPAFAGESLPICIRQGALGNDLPLRDLFVSPGHALYIDNCLLIDAKALVNGTTITQVTQWEGDVQYLHIETEHHEIILAEGTPAETFMDNVSRTCFNNYSEYESLYPQATEMIELDIPRVSHQRQLPNAVKAKLEAISEVLMGEGDRVKERMVG
ncbi:Hint domain-containing protein [Polynucleobacter sp. JS-JIR-II-c23]|uniref:Hint domain-containing protein n=1 Tax=Polynucleobacter sp. JS-JIR-II-c23 TaxID=1758393 RepID=UPI002B23888A|nr:Hint domain-containing protein [Polynucleobacter sp. JS-JIR-II-c23]MEA9603818.1 Hint domain-containing protein [Polynucleobacter sp. JS-JIR-II-c23]